MVNPSRSIVVGSEGCAPRRVTEIAPTWLAWRTAASSGWPDANAAASAPLKASPAAVLDSVHHLLQALSRVEMFVTVFYGIVEGSSRRLTYARAGHDYPLVLRRGLALPLAGEGTALGFPGVEDLHLTEEQVDLQPGDRLVLYTDGLVDARASDGRWADRRIA